MSRILDKEIKATLKWKYFSEKISLKLYEDFFFCRMSKIK